MMLMTMSIVANAISSERSPSPQPSPSAPPPPLSPLPPPPPPPPPTPITPSQPAEDSFVQFLRKDWYMLIVIFLIVLAGICCVYTFRYSRRMRKRRRHLNDEEKSLLRATEIDPSLVFIHEVIGIGSFAIVYRGTFENREVAVKVMRARDETTIIQNQLMAEASIMLKLKHPNIIQFLGASLKEPPDLFIITEYLPRGSLYALLHDPDFIIYDEYIKRFCVDTCKGMTYLHLCNILHRDLKTHNLLVGDDWEIKVCDFGLSRTLTDAGNTQSLTACGTPSWAAPEVLKEQRYSAKADIYSFGVCLWEMCSRQRPYQNMTTPQVVISVAVEGKRLPVKEGTAKEFSDIMKACWNADPHLRPSFSELYASFEMIHFPHYDFPEDVPSHMAPLTVSTASTDVVVGVGGGGGGVGVVEVGRGGLVPMEPSSSSSSSVRKVSSKIKTGTSLSKVLQSGMKYH